MSITTLPRSISHPPDIEDREVLTIPVPAVRRGLPIADRLSLSIGLWLLLRAQRSRRRPNPYAGSDTFRPLGERHLSERESLTVLAYDLQRRLL